MSISTMIVRRRLVDWNLPDPKGKPIEEVRAIRDKVEGRVKDLAAQPITVKGETYPPPKAET